MHPQTLLFIELAMADWLVAGACDWWCHRRTRIEATSGLAESLLHWLMLTLGAVGLLLALALQPSLALMTVLFVLWLGHQTVTWLELRYVVQRRNVRPIEQMVHSFLELIPLGLIVVMALDVWFTGASRPGGWTLKARPWESLAPLPLALYAAGTVVLVVVPFAEETWRCHRYRRRQKGPAGAVSGSKAHIDV